MILNENKLLCLVESYEKSLSELEEKKIQARQEAEAYLLKIAENADKSRFAGAIEQKLNQFRSRFSDRILKNLHPEGSLRKEEERLLRASPDYKEAMKRALETDSESELFLRAREDPTALLESPQGVDLLMRNLKKEEKNEYDRLVRVSRPRNYAEFEDRFFEDIQPGGYVERLLEARRSDVEEYIATKPLSFVRNGPITDPKDILKRLSSKAGFTGLFDDILNKEQDARRVISADLRQELPLINRARRLSIALGDPEGRRFKEQLHKKAGILYTQLLEAFVKAYPRRALEGLLAQNPLYGEEIVDEQTLRRMQEELRHNIVTAIPDDYCDLYPETRRMKRRFVFHVGPTNSGKTYNAMEALKKHKNGVYLAPLRMLALEKFDELNAAGCPCDLRTGEEEKIVPNARFTASTVEMADLDKIYECAVIDEAQMITDPYRGGAWTSAILGLRAREIHLCMSPWAEEVLGEIVDRCGDKRKTVSHIRFTELTAETEPFYLPMSVQEHDALIVFSRKSVHAVAAILEGKGVACSVIYGGLPYDVRQNEAERFRRGQTKVAVCTDAVGMGLNLPIRRIVFLEGEKFDGKDHRELTDEEIRQIAGRAGRRGLFEEGFVTSTNRAWNRRIRYALEVRKPSSVAPAIGFPEPLLGIERPVSQLMEEWQKMPPSGNFRKEDLSEEIVLAREAEKLTADRRMVFRLAMIPLDQKNPVAMEVWHELSEEAVRGTIDRVKLYTPNMKKELGELEAMFHVWDVYSQFGRVFGLEPMKEKAAEVKLLISSAIIEKLREGSKEKKCCKKCGRPLPWNYKFAVCEFCLSEEYVENMEVRIMGEEEPPKRKRRRR